MSQICIKQFAFLLCIVFLLILCGCQETEQFETERLDYLPLDDETVAYMESLYGQKKEKILKELGLSRKIFTIESWNGIEHILWTGSAHINEPTAVPEKEFVRLLGLARNYTNILGFKIKSDQFYGIEYTCFCEDEKEMADITEALYLAAEEKYSMGPKHGHFTSLDYLCGEGVFDDIRESGDDEIQKYLGGWSEAWVVGEYSYLQLTARVKDEYGRKFAVELKYSILPEEWSRFDPESEPQFYLRPQLQYGTHVDDWPEEYQEKQQALMREKFPGSNPEEE